MALDRESLRAYKRRWEEVRRIEEEERRNATLTERWRKLNSLLRMASALGLEVRTDKTQIGAKYERWNRLRDMFLAQKGEDPS